MTKKKTIGFYPGTSWHAYQKLLATELFKAGFNVVEGDDFTNEALKNTNQDILSFHWIERFWEKGTYFQRVKCLLGVWRYLCQAKALGKIIIWTVHNHQPHQNPSFLDKIGVQIFCWHAHIIACHSQWSKGWIKKASIKNVSPIVVYHGNFSGVFKGISDNRNLKKSLGLSTKLLCIGMIGEIRPNRGHELAINVINNFSNVQLLIAGRCKDALYLKELQNLIHKSSNNKIIIKVGNLSDSEYNEFVAVTDASLLPYHNVTTSGALMSSWTIGTPVIASDLPYFTEMISKGGSADSTFSLNNEAELIELIKQYTELDWLQVRRDTLQNAEHYRWDLVVKPLIEKLNLCLAKRTK
jgi:beta-1,4-mannosyltransferase